MTSAAAALALSSAFSASSALASASRRATCAAAACFAFDSASRCAHTAAAVCAAAWAATRVSDCRAWFLAALAFFSARSVSRSFSAVSSTVADSAFAFSIAYVFFIPSRTFLLVLAARLATRPAGITCRGDGCGDGSGGGTTAAEEKEEATAAGASAASASAPGPDSAAARPPLSLADFGEGAGASEPVGGHSHPGGVSSSPSRGEGRRADDPVPTAATAAASALRLPADDPSRLLAALDREGTGAPPPPSAPASVSSSCCRAAAAAAVAAAARRADLAFDDTAAFSSRSEADAALEFRRWCSLTLTRSRLGVLCARTRVWLLTLVVCDAAPGDRGAPPAGPLDFDRWCRSEPGPSNAAAAAAAPAAPAESSARLSLRDDGRTLLSYTKGGDPDPPVSELRRFARCSVREGPDGIGGGEGDGCGVDDRESSPSPTSSPFS